MRKSTLFVLNTAGRKSRLTHRQLRKAGASAACLPRAAHLRLSCAGQEQGCPWEVNRPSAALRGRLKSREEEERVGTQFKAEVLWPPCSGKLWVRKCRARKARRPASPLQDGVPGKRQWCCWGPQGAPRPEVLALARSTLMRREREDRMSFTRAGKVSTISPRGNESSDQA